MLINWLDLNKTSFKIISAKLNNSLNVKLESCETKYCPLNAKSFFRKLPYYLLWQEVINNNTNKHICIDIIFGGGLLTECEQIKKYIELNKNKISSLTIRLIGFHMQMKYYK